MVGNLRNVDEALAQAVADELGMPLPEASDPAAVEPRTDLPESAALSILHNGPDSFAGRKLGVLVTDGIGTARWSRRSRRPSRTPAPSSSTSLLPPVPLKLKGGQTRWSPTTRSSARPRCSSTRWRSLPSADGAQHLAARKTARDFVDDAFAHHKFLGWSADAQALLDAAGVTPDDGCPELTAASVTDFLEQCAALRHWERPVQD